MLDSLLHSTAESSCLVPAGCCPCCCICVAAVTTAPFSATLPSPVGEDGFTSSPVVSIGWCPHRGSCSSYSLGCTGQPHQQLRSSGLCITNCTHLLLKLQCIHTDAPDHYFGKPLEQFRAHVLSAGCAAIRSQDWFCSCIVSVLFHWHSMSTH